MGDWGLNGLKPKAKFLMLLYSEQDLQGLGFSVGAPKPSFSTAMMMIMMVCWGFWVEGLKENDILQTVSSKALLAKNLCWRTSGASPKSLGFRV